MNDKSIEKLDRELIKAEDISSLATLFPSIRHDWDVKPIFRTETEARISVLNEIHFPTPHAKYWQSIREQQVHFDQLVWLSFDYKRKKLELVNLEKAHERESRWWRLNSTPLLRWNARAADLLAIDIEQKKYEIFVCEKVAAERVREIKQWAKIKDELLESHANEIDTESADTLQLKSYTKTFIIEMFNSGPNIGAGEAQNIIGKARTAISRCKAMKVWDEVKREMNLSPQQLKDLGE